jgi:hypothetical protein
MRRVCVRRRGPMPGVVPDSFDAAGLDAADLDD